MPKSQYISPSDAFASGFLTFDKIPLCQYKMCIRDRYGIALGTSGGKAGFITATYILLVPLFGLFRGKKVPLRIWICVFAALCGLYLLCITGDFSFLPSDGMVLLGAVFWALHILVRCV